MEDLKLDAPEAVAKLPEKIDSFHSELFSLINKMGSKIQEVLFSTKINNINNLIDEYGFEDKSNISELEALLDNLPDNVFQAFLNITDRHPSNSREDIVYRIIFGLAKNSFGGGLDMLSPYIQRKNPLNPKYASKNPFYYN